MRREASKVCADFVLSKWNAYDIGSFGGYLDLEYKNKTMGVNGMIVGLPGEDRGI